MQACVSSLCCMTSASQMLYLILCAWLVITQTPYIFNTNVKYIRIFIIFNYCFYLFFTLYFYFHVQQVSYGYHACITTTNLIDSFPSSKGRSENLFFRYFYIVAKRFEYSSVSLYFYSIYKAKLLSVSDNFFVAFFVVFPSLF